MAPATGAARRVAPCAGDRHDNDRLLHPTGSGATLPAVAPTVRLDYGVLGPSLAPALASRRIGDASLPTMLAASDHLPLLTVLEV